ncbi:MAG: hypothetical protein ACOC42_03935 [Halobacteriota archaeon]
MASGHRSAILTAVRSAVAGGRSYLLRAYAVVGSVLIVLTAVLVILALPTWVARSAGTSATLVFGQALLVLVGLGVIVALFLPLYLAHRRLPDPGVDRRLERRYGAFGFAIALSVYVALLISAPPDARGEPPALLAPVIEPLYALDPRLALVPPIATVALLLAVDRRLAD